MLTYNIFTIYITLFRDSYYYINSYSYKYMMITLYNIYILHNGLYITFLFVFSKVNFIIQKRYYNILYTNDIR